MSRECLTTCPYATECIENLFRLTQIPSSANKATATAMINELVEAVAGVALADCKGPPIETHTVEKNGYFESKKPVDRNVFVCSVDGHTQTKDYYYRKDQMPEQ